MKKILISYLTSNDRHFVFKKFIDELDKISFRDEVKLLIINSVNNFDFYENYLKEKKISYDLSFVSCPQSDYLPKIRHAIEYAKKHNFDYVLKCDNDVLIPSYTLEYIIKNINLLDLKDNLTISPTLSTGIPSVEYFVDDFCTKDEVEIIRNEFKKCEFNIQGGIMDYTPLNELTIKNKESWNYELYFNTLRDYTNKMPDFGNGRTINNYLKFYKGIHPIRHGFGNDIINDIIIKRKKDFFKEKKCSIILDDKPYLCNMCFFISTENYDKIINRENLIVDGCDEVPLNRFAWNNNMKHLIVKSGYAIHISYNWRWFLNNIDGGSNISKPNISLNEFEENFIKQLYDTN
jgi:hypothetical protein